MRTTSTLPAVILLICLIATGALAQEFMGPKLEGTVTLRSGQQITGVILTAQLGIVDGAEIGSRLRDGGYIAVKVDGDESRVNAADIAAINVEWSQTGTDDDPKWKITSLSVTTRSDEVITGQPAWLVHATSLIVETADGTQQKIYAFPMAGSNFSPDNLMASVSLTGAAPATADPATTEPATGDEPGTDPATVTPGPVITPIEMPPAGDTGTGDPATGDPATADPAPDVPVAGGDVVTVEPGPVAGVGDPVVDPGPAVGIGVGQPTVEPVPDGSVFATGQPAVITFEVTNPATGEPMMVRFLIVPLPAQ